MLVDSVLPQNGQTLVKEGGFSLHAGVSAKSHQRDKVERLCRYIARPAVSKIQSKTASTLELHLHHRKQNDWRVRYRWIFFWRDLECSQGRIGGRDYVG